MGLPKNDKMANVDAYGLKVLFNHGLRRFMTGSKNRVPRLNLVLVPLHAYGPPIYEAGSKKSHQ